MCDSETGSLCTRVRFSCVSFSTVKQNPPELQIHDILVGSGSADPNLWLMDPGPDPAIFVSDLQGGPRKFPSFSCLLFYEGTFTSFFKDKKS
jgi:hypothetical protein